MIFGFNKKKNNRRNMKTDRTKETGEEMVEYINKIIKEKYGLDDDLYSLIKRDSDLFLSIMIKEGYLGWSDDEGEQE